MKNLTLYEGFLNLKNDKYFYDYSHSVISDIVVLLDEYKPKYTLNIKYKVLKDNCNIYIYNKNNRIFEIAFYINPTKKTIHYSLRDYINKTSVIYYLKKDVYKYITNILSKMSNNTYINNLIDMYIKYDKLNNIDLIALNVNIYDYITVYLINNDNKYIQYINFDYCSDMIKNKYKHLIDAKNFDIL